jgi:hypothetical protein
LDALVAAPGHHALLLENERTRVVRTRILPGQIVPVHTHRWPGVLFITAWSDLLRRDPQGTVLLDTRQLPDKPGLNVPQWQEPLPPHTVENVGSAEFDAVQVEMKDGAGSFRPLKFRRVAGCLRHRAPGFGRGGPLVGCERRFHLNHSHGRRTLSRLPHSQRAKRCRSRLALDLLQAEGPFPFSQTGVLLSFIEPLSASGIPIFGISTYDTDYVLVQEGSQEAALDALLETGHDLL